MALKIQYNKTYLQQLGKALQVRENALPTLQAKESALRLEVKKAKQDVVGIERELEEKFSSVRSADALWCEFPEGMLSVERLEILERKIAGVKTPVLQSIAFSVTQYSLFAAPSWIPMGIDIMKELVSITVKRDVARERLRMLEWARKRTTQKVNLYEKVQIPEYREALLKIKRFLEDEENLAKASQKILKERLAAAEIAA